MNADSLLAKAARLARSRRYGEAIRLLEPEVVRYHDSFRYYFILGYSCLQAGDFGGSFTYFRRAREIKMRDPAVLLGLAALHLRRGETDRAIDLYLDILEKESGNRIAQRALDVVRKRGDPEVLGAWIEAGKLVRIYPPAPSVPGSARRAALIVGGTFLALSVSVLALLALGILASPFSPGMERPGLEGTDLAAEDREGPVQIGGAYRYVLTKRQILDAYAAAQRLFRDYRDDAARVELNRILESNASEAVKEKARILASFAAAPGFDTLKDRFPYSAVAAEPVLYRGCHVIWRGMAANLVEAERATSFDLLVGYDTRNALEGIVNVRFDFAVAVDQERPLEILGRVVPTFAAAGESALRIEGVALHQAASLGEGRK